MLLGQNARLISGMFNTFCRLMYSLTEWCLWKIDDAFDSENHGTCSPVQFIQSNISGRPNFSGTTDTGNFWMVAVIILSWNISKNAIQRFSSSADPSRVGPIGLTKKIRPDIHYTESINSRPIRYIVGQYHNIGLFLHNIESLTSTRIGLGNILLILFLSSRGYHSSVISTMKHCSFISTNIGLPLPR